MIGDSKKVVSPSRTYVAVCNKSWFDGHYFRKFVLPKTLADVPEHARAYIAVHEIIEDGDSRVKVRGRNDAAIAGWYFLNVIDAHACIDGVVTWEDFQDLEEVK